MGATTIEAGEAAHGPGHGACLNCGTALIGPHCHRCGQSAHIHRTVGAVGHEIAHGVFHFEGRVWRTLPMLVLHPGRLTRRYIDGERARFVSPLALFLFAIFLLFATLGWVGVEPVGVSRTMQAARHRAAYDDERARVSDKLAAARKVRADAVAAGTSTVDADAKIRSLSRILTVMGPASGAVAARPDDGHFVPDAALAEFHSGWHRIDAGLQHANANPDLALYKLQSSAYKYSWLLIPLSTPFVALLFLWRRRFGLYDHAIFVTYSLCFMLLLVTALTILGAVGLSGVFLALIAVAVPPVHLFAQLRGTYALGRFGAGWRTAVLLGFAFTALLLFTMLLLAHGLTE